MVLLISLGIFFLLQELMPGFNIEEYEFNGIDTGNLVIHPFTITSIITMVIGSAGFSFVSSMLKVLEKSS